MARWGLFPHYSMTNQGDLQFIPSAELVFGYSSLEISIWVPKRYWCKWKNNNNHYTKTQIHPSERWQNLQEWPDQWTDTFLKRNTRASSAKPKDLKDHKIKWMITDFFPWITLMKGWVFSFEKLSYVCEILNIYLKMLNVWTERFCIFFSFFGIN